MKPNTLFPIFLKVEELEILIVGGGNTGLEKISAILKSSPGASITLVGESIHAGIEKLAVRHPGVTLINRFFQERDLVGKNILILAANNRSLHEAIRQNAKNRNILVNVADTPELCDFYLGSIVTKGSLKLGISTNGQSPTMAKRLREFFEAVLPEDMDKLLLRMKAIRNQVKGDLQKKVQVLNRVTESWHQD